MKRDSVLNLSTAAAMALASVASAATITVNSSGDAAADDGACTLREAIASASANLASGASSGECAAGEPLPAVDTIAFAIPGAGVHTIQPTSPLPTIDEAVVIDGYTQPGASPNTLAVGDDAVLSIEIDGSQSPGVADLLRIPNSGSTVRGLVVNRVSGTSIFVGFSSFDGDDNRIEGNFFNTDPSGTVMLGGNFTVIRIAGAGNTIGGASPAARNVIGGGGGSNAGTLMIGGGGNVVQGNYIGIDASGTVPLQPSSATNGIELGTGGPASNTRIGGDAPGEGNVVFSTNIGIRVSGGVTDTTIQGNLLGTDATASISLGANIGISTDNGPQSILIGGTTPGAGNVVSGGTTGINLGDGPTAVVIQGNRIGTDATGRQPIRNLGDAISIFTPGVDSVIGGTDPGAANTIANNCGQGIRIGGGSHWAVLGNSIHSNGGLGISLGSPGSPTQNDSGDGDAGPNDLQNYPVVTSAVVADGTATISGTLNSTPATTFRVEFFASAFCDTTGYGEGQQYLGTADVTTDGNGDASFGPLAFPAPDGADITATATDPDGNTSEFSECAGPHNHIFSSGFETSCSGG